MASPQARAVERRPGTPGAAHWPGPKPQSFVSPPTLNELVDNLATITVILDGLRRTRAWDFEVQPNHEAWSRLSREADDLLAEIRSAKRR